MDLFPETGRPLPAASNRRSGQYLAASERPSPVRFADGYLPFEVFVREQGIDPAPLAKDASALWEFLASRTTVTDDPALLISAARFAGNVVAVMHPAATWRVLSQPEIGTATRSIPVTSLVEMMVTHPEQRQPFLDMLSTWEQEDSDEAEYRALSQRNPAPPLAIPPNPFPRPVFSAKILRDEDGHEVSYGSRWDGSVPPEEAYSRVTNPARFAPLALDVDALTGYLRTWYLVDVAVEMTGVGAQRATFHPTTGTPMTITVNADSATLEAGALFIQTFPNCSCDACDEDAHTAADDLERHVLAIAAGGFREIYPIGHRQWALTGFHYLDGTSTTNGGAPHPQHTTTSPHEAEQALAHLTDGWWPAWTLR